jgi:hypothetical protein
MFEVRPVVQLVNALGPAATIVLIVCLTLLVLVFLFLLALVNDFPQRVCQVLQALQPFFLKQRRRSPTRRNRSDKGGRHA